MYLEALEYSLQFLLPKIVLKILHMLDIVVSQLVPNAWHPFYRSLQLASSSVLSIGP